MCGRYALYADVGVVELLNELDRAADFKPSYNIAPTQNIPAITVEEGKRRLKLYRWGLVPFWSKEIGKYSTINARAETVATKPTFRAPFRNHRCLIPANGYYEWQQLAHGKQPWYIHAHDDDLLFFAGLWDHWQPAEGEPVDSAAIVVTEANADTKKIHDRMPVILAKKDWDAWLDPDNHNVGALEKLLRPAPRGSLAARPVSARVNSPRNNGPELLKEAEVAGS